MIPAQRAISRFRRDLTLGTVLNCVLAVGALIGLIFPGGGYVGMVVLALVAAVWLGLSYQSVKGSRLAAASPGLIASGQLDLAEHQIESALRSFSLFRAAKLMVMHHLAMLRHAQRRWEDCAQLCRALLQQRMGSARNLERPTRLMLAEALLEMGDLNGAYQQLVSLYQQRLSLHEAINLMALQLDYEAHPCVGLVVFAGFGQSGAGRAAASRKIRPRTGSSGPRREKSRPAGLERLAAATGRAPGRCGRSDTLSPGPLGALVGLTGDIVGGNTRI